MLKSGRCSSKPSTTEDPIGVESTMDPVVDVTSHRISVDKVIKSVMDESAGGTVVFIGSVRNRSRGMQRVTRIELESAKDLARADLLRISKKARANFGISRIAIRHRVGRLAVGDVILVVAVSAPHRRAAFAACRYIIDELKKSTPIWKKEFGPRGSIWVQPEG